MHAAADEPAADPARRATEADLIRRCEAGELSAFEELYHRHAGRLYTLAWRMTGNAADAEDLLQEIFLAAFRKLGSFKAESSLGTWLYRLAMNRCLDHLRSRAARMGRSTMSLDAEEWSGPSPASAPDATASRLDLEAAIARLPDGYRAAFVLHDVEGLDHREVARTLNISEGTSKSQVHKARLRLRTLLDGS